MKTRFGFACGALIALVVAATIGSAPAWAVTDAGGIDLLGGDNTAVGLRDHAVVVVLARLGLRAGEVAGLDLDDVDWRAGELVVRGKGARRDRLPVPVDVGEALVAYLQGGRPRADTRALFVRVHAPIGLVTNEASSLPSGLRSKMS